MQTHSRSEILSYVQKYGWHSNSFMTLYPGFQYFKSHRQGIEGSIAYLELSHTWVGGAEPITPANQQLSLLEEFAKTAGEVGKSAVLLPVHVGLACKAHAKGYQTIMIGSEPTFDLKAYPHSGKSWLDTVPSAKTVSKSATVTEFKPSDSSSAVRSELESIQKEWLDSRKMSPLGFLNQVDPWTLSEFKRYFLIYVGNEILAFLSAVPIWPSNGWYINDVFRRNHTPAGTTELLSLEAMRLLRLTGAEKVTFGVSPLALLESVDTYLPSSTQNSPKLYTFLKHLYDRGDWFYNFKTLFQYKWKFQPSYCEPAFMVFISTPANGLAIHPKHTAVQKMGFWQILNVFQAFSGGGVTAAFLSNIFRSISQLTLDSVLDSFLTKTVVTRPYPKKMSEALYRGRLTWSLFFLNLIVYLGTSQNLEIISTIEKRWGFSWDKFIHSPLQALLFSPFLHWDLFHLMINLVCLVLFTANLEYLAGSTFVLFCYGIPMLISNPITSIILVSTGNILSGEIDVGASLGIFGCAGALGGSFLKRGWIVVGGLCAVTVIQAFYLQSWLALNHIISILLGLFLGKLLLAR